jgi:hypothetical protein
VNTHILGIQQHPDFTKELCLDLITKRKKMIGEKYQNAIDSLSSDHDGQDVSQWMANFFSV